MAADSPLEGSEKARERDEASMTAALAPFGWTCGPDFWQRYYVDAWVFNLANAVESLSESRAALEERATTAENALAKAIEAGAYPLKTIVAGVEWVPVNMRYCTVHNAGAYVWGADPADCEQQCHGWNADGDCVFVPMARGVLASETEE